MRARNEGAHSHARRTVTPSRPPSSLASRMRSSRSCEPLLRSWGTAWARAQRRRSWRACRAQLSAGRDAAAAAAAAAAAGRGREVPGSHSPGCAGQVQRAPWHARSTHCKALQACTLRTYCCSPIIRLVWATAVCMRAASQTATLLLLILAASYVRVKACRSVHLGT